MKKLVFFMIAAAIIGKVFAAELLRLAESSSATSKGLGQNLYLEKATNEQLNLDHIRSKINMIRRIPPRTFAINKPIARAPITPLVSKVTKTDEKAKGDTKDNDKERRKERQKKLEEKANQTAQAKPVVATPVIPPPLAPVLPDYSSANVILPGPAVSAVPPANTNPNLAPTAQAPVVPVNVSTLSNNNAVNGWIKLLTTDPTAAAMTNFEAQYTKNTITQAEYYQVLTAMQSSSNTESRNYAVQGANLYQNISSFKILADESKNETNSSVKAAAAGDLNSYENTADIPILQSAAATGDAAEKAVANAFLQIIAGTNPTAPATSTFHL